MGHSSVFPRAGRRGDGKLSTRKAPSTHGEPPGCNCYRHWLFRCRVERKWVEPTDREGEGPLCPQQRASMVSETGDKDLMMSRDPTGGTEKTCILCPALLPATTFLCYRAKLLPTLPSVSLFAPEDSSAQIILSMSPALFLAECSNLLFSSRDEKVCLSQAWYSINAGWGGSPRVFLQSTHPLRFYKWD